MNPLGLTDDKLNALLQVAGQKLGQDPQKLKEQLQAGQLDGVLGKMDPKAAAQMGQMLQNPKAVEAMLQNPQVLSMLSKLMGGKK